MQLFSESAGAARGVRPHQFSPVFTSLWAAVEVNALQTKYDIYWGAIAELKNGKHIPMSPKDGMTVEEVSLAALAVLGVVGLAYFIATALEVLPIISAS
jgi:hypothetical protein